MERSPIKTGERGDKIGEFGYGRLHVGIQHEADGPLIFMH